MDLDSKEGGESTKAEDKWMVGRERERKIENR